jgi:tight adherence protein B
MNSLFLIPALAFVSVACIIGVMAFVFRDQTPKTATRLDMLIGKRRRDDEGTDILRKTAFENDKQSLLELLMPRFMSPQKYFEQADCHIKPNTLLMIGFLLAVVGGTVSYVARAPLIVVPMSAVLMFFLPFIWLWNKRRVRLNKFASQLPDALELLARALRAGQSLQAGMHVVGEEMPAPIADEFSRVYEEQNLGISVEDSLKNICDRVPNLDLRFFVTSVGIQRSTGGDLAEILDKIGYVIRERWKILGQVKALTGEGRLSGVVLIALPFTLFGYMLVTRPDYIEPLWTDPLGIKMSVLAIVAQILGALVIRKIVNIKV